MARTSISIGRFMVKPFDCWANQWFLLTAGDFKKGTFNTMTVGWGSLGTMWGKPRKELS